MTFAVTPEPERPSRPEAGEPLVEMVVGLRGRGSDPRGAVTIELDGTGRATAVEVTSTAMEGNRGTMERAIREALDAAWTDLDATRREHAPQISAAAAAQVGDLTEQARSFAAAAEARLQRALQAVAAASARAEGEGA